MNVVTLWLAIDRSDPENGCVRVVPGSYLARLQPDGFNPGAGYIRLALVQDGETTAQALHRLVETLG
jgi:ectoine hydroxylase-related dioxygenase (phytanoyl-CoA dioxygenase family)